MPVPLLTCRRLMLGSILLGILAIHAQGDYVETAPRPGAPPQPAIPLGQCPLVFLQSDVQHAKQSACLSSTSELPGLPLMPPKEIGGSVRLAISVPIPFQMD
jgi:hypothetical protein